MGLFEVYRGLAAGFGNGANPGVQLNTMAHQVVMDWRQAMVLDGRAYQVKAGTISGPLTGDEAISDATAEMSADAALGTTIIPVSCGITLDALGGNAFEAAAKSVAVVSSGGTAFIPLPMKSGGSASVSSARVDPAGGVTVPAEVSTTTLRHFEWSNEFAQIDVDDNHPAGNPFLWEPVAAPVLVGPRSFYVQIASASTGPVYFAHFDYIEVPTLMVNPS